MPMQMGFRWYGEGNDQITLDYIKQIPGVSTIVWALHHKMPGEIWEEHEIAEVMDQLHKYGFNGDVVESVNVHDDIKIGEGDAEIGTNVDAISGATVTSKAIARSVNSAVGFVTGADTSSAATSWGG